MKYTWRDEAVCSGADYSEFSYPEKVGSQHRSILVMFTKEYCDRCPVKKECLEDATPDDLRYTVRGGRLPSGRGSRPELIPLNAKLPEAELRDRQDKNSPRMKALIEEYMAAGVCKNGHDIGLPHLVMLRNTKTASGARYYYPTCRVCQTVARREQRLKKKLKDAMMAA